jgi:pimeloyl-ACP methyl ester carboxylesterase
MELTTVPVSLAQSWRRLQRAMASRLALVSPRGLALLPCATPIGSIAHPAARRTERLIVFLPGIGDIAEDFEARGFIAAIGEHPLHADAVAVDAHYGYYARRSVIDRLAHDVVLPARQRGYHDIWLVGISMGGMGALSYAMHHPQHLARVVLLAPYLGDARLTREIAEARNLPRRRAHETSAEEHMRRVWDWVKRYDQDPALLPQLYLGYGTRDRFAGANALLARHLSPENVVALSGGHDWRTWTRLWNAFLAQWTDEAARAS